MHKSLNYQRGFTLLELILTIAIVGIVASVAAPAMTTMFAISDVRSAKQNIAQSLRQAKQVARTVNTTVTVNLTLNPQGNTVTYSLPNGSNQLPDGILMNSIILENDITVSSTNNNSSISFNPLGVIDVNDVGVITLTSNRDSSVTGTVTLLNLLGQIEVN